MNVQERWEAVGSGGFGFKHSYASTTLPTLAETLRASTGTRMARRARSRAGALVATARRAEADSLGRRKSSE